MFERSLCGTGADVPQGSGLCLAIVGSVASQVGAGMIADASGHVGNRVFYNTVIRRNDHGRVDRRGSGA
ncbi:hypothetical protein [Sphingobium sp.]|uniref:hypothetical protein n=1 Tax=Sphingobium sp. TaxID=1912891 RepID=UPI003BB4A305